MDLYSKYSAYTPGSLYEKKNITDTEVVLNSKLHVIVGASSIPKVFSPV